MTPEERAVIAAPAPFRFVLDTNPHYPPTLWLMAGESEICLGEIQQRKGVWLAAGYGRGRHLGTFPSKQEAADAVIADARLVLKAAGLTPTTPN